MPETPITTARAREINALVVAAWLVREGLSDDPLPDLSTVPLADCIAASNAVAGLPGTRNADGSTTILCRVVASRIPTLYAWRLPLRRWNGFAGSMPMAETHHPGGKVTLRVLVCGGRNYTDLGAVWGHLDAYHAMQGPIAVIIHGGAKGADMLAEKWAVYNGVRHQKFAADWAAHGPAAGPIRNRRMLVEGKPDVVIAFPGGRGTADMVWQARDAGVEVVVVDA